MSESTTTTDSAQRGDRQPHVRPKYCVDASDSGVYREDHADRARHEYLANRWRGIETQSAMHS